MRLEDGASDADQPTVSEQRGVRYLHFDSPWIQGAMDLKRPNRLVLAYTEQMMGWLLFLHPEKKQVIGQLGLGAASLTRFCYQHLPNPLVVVERSPAVVRACEQFFRLPRQARLSVIEQDAQRWVLNPQNWSSLSVLMVDLYDTDALGPVCDSVEFYQGCFECLDEPGILSVNLFGKHESFASNIENIESVFGARVILLPPVDEGNQIVLAFKGPLLSATRQDIAQRAQWIEQAYGLPAKRWARSIGAVQSL